MPNSPFAYVKNNNTEKKFVVTVAARGSISNPKDQVIHLAPGQRVQVGATKAENYGDITYSVAGASYEN